MAANFYESLGLHLHHELPSQELNRQMQFSWDLSVFVLRKIRCVVRIADIVQSLEIFISQKPLLYDMLILGTDAFEKFGAVLMFGSGDLKVRRKSKIRFFIVLFFFFPSHCFLYFF